MFFLLLMFISTIGTYAQENEVINYYLTPMGQIRSRYKEVSNKNFVNSSPTWKSWKEEETEEFVSLDPIHGYTLLHFGILTQGDEIIQQGLKQKKNLNAQDNDGCTPLHLAVLMENLDVLELLLLLKADPNIPNYNGDTPLLLAVRQGVSFYLIKYLLKNGADPNIKDAQNRTIVEVAQDNDRDYMIGVLKRDLVSSSVSKTRNLSPKTTESPRIKKALPKKIEPSDGGYWDALELFDEDTFFIEQNI